MPRYKIGSIRFYVSPVALMQCWVGIGWCARAEPEEIKEYQRFTQSFFPWLLEQDPGGLIEGFCKAAVKHIDQTVERLKLSTDFVLDFARRLKGRLSVENQRACSELSDEYCRIVETWLDSSVGRLGACATELLTKWGMPPPYRAIAAVNKFGSAVFGKYVPDLKAVCLQLDVIKNDATPALQLLETLLHEEIHAYIYLRMGDDEDRRELTWLDELCAVLTSQHALRTCAARHLDAGEKSKVDAALDRMRKEQKYGKLAEAVLRDTNDALLPLKAWKRIFELEPDKRRNYACDNIITPILNGLGWKVTFPYEYEDRYVTVFRC